MVAAFLSKASLVALFSYLISLANQTVSLDKHQEVGLDCPWVEG
jgi:hypothetical protein